MAIKKYLSYDGLLFFWTQLKTLLAGKVDVVDGKSLSTNDYTNAEKTKLAGIETGAQVNTVTGIKGSSETDYRVGNINITAANIGLGNVNNTADSVKSVASAVTATKLGSTTVGSGTQPIFLNTGTATASTSTVGGTTQPVYMNTGVISPTTYSLSKSVPADAVFTDTHYTSSNVVGGTATDTANSSTALSNGNVFLNSVENGDVTSSNKITGSGATTVTTDASGNIIVTSTDNNTTYSAGTGLSLSGTTFNHSNNITAGTASGDASKTLTFDGTFAIPSVTYDATGHVTSKGTTTMTMPGNPNTDTMMTQTVSTTNSAYPVLLSSATTTGTRTGLMTTGVTVNPSTKTVVASIFNGALSGNATTATTLATSRNISLSGGATGTATSFNGSADISIPVTALDASVLTGTASVSTTGNASTATKATQDASGNVITSTYVKGLSASGRTVTVTKGDNTTSTFTTQDTTYSAATTSTAGLMSAADKTKLDGVASGAQVNVIETIKLNGTALTPSSKTVNISVITSDQVDSKVSTAIAGITTFSFVITTLNASTGEPDVASPSTSVIYLTPRTAQTDNAYTEWAYISSKWEIIGSTDVDLSGYQLSSELVAITNAEITTILAS